MAKGDLTEIGEKGIIDVLFHIFFGYQKQFIRKSFSLYQSISVNDLKYYFLSETKHYLL